MCAKMAVTKITFNELLFRASYSDWVTLIRSAIIAFYGASIEWETPSEEAYKMLIYYALPKCGKRIAGFYSETEGDDPSDEIIARISGWLKGSEARYKAILEAYKKEEDLLAKVETKEGVSLMPQSSTLSDYNKTTPELDDLSRVTIRQSDAMTPIERLAEIEDNITSAYENWANEFIKAFVIDL